MVCIQIRITGLAREIFPVGRGQLYRRRQEMSGFFVHKKHTSKHEIVAHRCHVIMIIVFGREPNVLSSGGPDLFRRFAVCRFRIVRHRARRNRIDRGQRERTVEVQPFGQMVRNQSYWLKTVVIVPANTIAAVQY